MEDTLVARSVTEMTNLKIDTIDFEFMTMRRTTVLKSEQDC